MKKLFSLLAAVLFVLSFAGAALAIQAEIPAETQAVVAKGSTQITLGGEIRVRGWYYNNMANYFVAPVPGTPRESNSKANWDQRVRLNLDIAASPNVSGKIVLETGNTDGSTTDIYSWGRLNQKPNGTTTLLEAWIQYKGSGLFGFPAGIKIGHMPLKLGEGIFFDNTQFGDDALVFFMDPTKDLHIGLLTIKASEGASQSAVYNTTTYISSRVCVDNSTSVLTYYSSTGPGNAASCPGGTTQVSSTTSTWSSSLKSRAKGGNALNTDDLDAYVGLFTYKLAPTHTIGGNYTYINQSDAALKFQNLGIHANGTAGNFGYKAEVDFQFGSVGDKGSKIDYRGWAAFLAANYRFSPEFNLRGSFAYGSGDGNDEDNKNKEFQTLVGGIQHYTFVYEYRARAAAQNAQLSGLTGGVGTGIANTTYYNIGADYQATKDLGFKADLFILRASKDRYHGSKYSSKNIGWELDGQMTYKLAKNLTYQINAGYLKAGKFYEYSAYTDWTRNDSQSDRKSATIVNNVLTLSF